MGKRVKDGQRERKLHRKRERERRTGRKTEKEIVRKGENDG